MCPYQVQQQLEASVFEEHSHVISETVVTPVDTPSTVTETSQEIFGTWMIAQKSNQQNRRNKSGKGSSGGDSAKSKGKMVTTYIAFTIVASERNQEGNKFDTLSDMEEGSKIYGEEITKIGWL